MGAAAAMPTAGVAVAPTRMRAAAFVIDRTIALALILAVTWVYPIGLFATGAAVRMIAQGVGFITFATAVTYAYARDGVGGQSIGRRLFRMRVIDTRTGQPIGPLRSVLREIPLHLGPVLIVELVLLLTGRRRLGDRLARSAVILDA